MNKPICIEAVVQNNMCIGCGVCAGICPHHALTMEFNAYGEYNPVQSSGCLTSCALCLQVCPFSEKEENEDTLAQASFSHVSGIKHHPEAGYYLDCYVGYSNINDHRAHGASGGMATWLLEALLTKGIVNYVVCVTPNDNPEKLFRFTIFNTSESIRQSAKSAYYPVEMSEVIREILKIDGRYAVIGLPCFLKGLRLASKVNKKLRERIVITAGLVCGQLKSKYFTEYLSYTLGGNPKRIARATFRIKDEKRAATDFGFTFEGEAFLKQERKSGTIFWTEGFKDPWVEGYFTLKACKLCDDVFAELADITFMDAWLPQFFKDGKGTSFIIIRKSSLLEIFKQGLQKKEIEIKLISIDSVIKSQRDIAPVLPEKRERLVARLWLWRKGEPPVPRKRVSVDKRPKLPVAIEEYIKELVRLRSRKAWRYCREQDKFQKFNKMMIPLRLMLHSYLFVQATAYRLKRKLSKRLSFS